ncbi:MAG: ABC transporter ATP-binding protein [Chloroflexota bacterium]|nr:ABC transporter ATP-binding protein [Chloroflexota bacterium]
MIKVQGLTKEYPSGEAVRDLSFHVPAGQLFVFLGPNGAGKSSTIKMLTGMLQPTSGSARIAGHDVVRQPLLVKRVIGYMAEYPFLYEKLTGREFIHFIADVYAVPKHDRNARTNRLLHAFELTESADLLIESYSQGMRQKIALAAVLIHQPKVLFLDEPTNALDPRGARVVKNILRQICDRGATVFMTTHILAVAEEMCDRVAILDAGRLKAIGTLPELRDSCGRPTASLEELFLSITGAAIYSDIGLYAKLQPRQ